jgi:hypothetical protein
VSGRTAAPVAFGDRCPMIARLRRSHQAVRGHTRGPARCPTLPACSSAAEVRGGLTARCDARSAGSRKPRSKAHRWAGRLHLRRVCRALQRHHREERTPESVAKTHARSACVVLRCRSAGRLRPGAGTRLRWRERAPMQPFGLVGRPGAGDPALPTRQTPAVLPRQVSARTLKRRSVATRSPPGWCSTAPT